MSRLAAAFLTLSSLASMTGAFAQEPSTVLITGSNRGLGLEFARQYAEKQWNVIATCRDPESAAELEALRKKHPNIAIERLDVADATQIAALAAKYRGRPIDVLLNNAGILGEPQQQKFGANEYEQFREVLLVNTYAPIEMAEHFADNVAASRQKKIVTITSGLGSMEITRRSGGLYAYRISKAGVNMAMRVLQADLRPRGITVGLLSPGMVDTRLLTQSGYKGEALKPADSVSALVGIIEKLTPEEGASFIHYDGSKLPW
jgi:NAD(P)-dependent dehydrogenase (short-subunit alcohol dehydrogenase family)